MSDTALHSTPQPQGTAAILVQNEFPEILAKAVSESQGPAYVRHSMYEVARRNAWVHQGIRADQTPHLDHRMLRALADRNIALRAIIQTILNQVSAHFVRPTDDRAIGAIVAHKDEKKQLTAVGEKMKEYIEGVLFRGGVRTENPHTGEPGVWDGHYERTADPLSVAIRKMMEESLVLDRVFLSVEGSRAIRGRKKHPVMYWKVEDGGLHYKADMREYKPQLRPELEGRVRHVMLDPGVPGAPNVMREYAWDEGLMGIRNPRAAFLANGYGYPETEQCLDAVLGVLYGLQINKEWHTQNHIPNGILNLIGNYTETQLLQLRMHIMQELSGPGSHFKLPIIVTPPGQGTGAQFVPFVDRTHMGMISEPYITLCVAFGSAVFQIAPEEFGFSSFGRPDNALQEGDSEGRMLQSQQRGLVPKVLWVCDLLTRLVELIDPDFCVKIQNLENRYNPEELAALQLDLQRMQAGMTMNQVAALRDEPRIYDPLDLELWREVEEKHAEKWYPGDQSRKEAIAKEYEKKGGKLGSYPDAPIGNPAAMQIWMQEHQQEQQEAQQMMGQMADSDWQQQEAEQAMQRQQQMGLMPEEQQQLSQGAAGQGQPGLVQKSIGKRRIVIRMEEIEE